jgi:hypothetical protein
VGLAMPPAQRYGSCALTCWALGLATACGGEPATKPPVPNAPSTQAPREPERSSFWLRTSPSNASVFVDGTLRGTTPLHVEDLQPGEHTLRVEAPGYLPTEWKKLRLPPGGMVLPEMVLLHDQDQPVHTSDSASEAPPPPPWRPGKPLPADFEATSALRTVDGWWLELSARGANLELQWLKRSGGVQTSCRPAVRRADIKAFGWPELERVVVSRFGRSIAPDQNLAVRGHFPPVRSSLMAHGHRLQWPEIDRLHLAHTIRDHLLKAIGPEVLEPSELHGALAGVVNSLFSCIEQLRMQLRVKLVVEKSTGRVRSQSLASNAAGFEQTLPGPPSELSPSELACAHRVLENALLPSSLTCDVEVELVVNGPRPRLPPGMVE